MSDYAVDFLSTRVKVVNALLCAVLLVIWAIASVSRVSIARTDSARLREELNEIARAIFFASGALLIVAQLGRWRTITILTAALVGLIAMLLIGTTRVLLRLNLRRLRLRGHNLKNILIIGTGPRAEWFAKQVLYRHDFGL